MNNNPSLSTNIAGIKMKNPVMVASGTFGYGEECKELVNLNKLGAIVTKTITLKRKSGNPPPRIVETAAGMLNAIGLENVGLDLFLKEKLPALKKVTSTPIIVSVGGESIEEYAKITNELSKSRGVVGIELNISCPNVKLQLQGKKNFSQDANATYKLVSSVRKVTKLPLIVKLSPNVTDITQIARSAKDGGADAISLINTLLGMAVDIHTMKPKLANLTGGLSGPAIKPIAVRMVWEIANTVNIPIIAMGGIMNAYDALEFFIVKATAVAVGVGNFVDPHSPLKIVEGIKNYLKERKIRHLKDLSLLS